MVCHPVTRFNDVLEILGSETSSYGVGTILAGVLPEHGKISRVSRFRPPYDDQASQAARKGGTVVCVRHGESEMPTAVML